MASNDGYVSDRNVTQQRIEVEEKVQNADSSIEVCCSTATNTNDLDEFIKTLNYDEIISSIEIVKQLQQALIDPDKTEIAEECAGNHTDVKEEKESESVLDSHPDECLLNQVHAGNHTDIKQEKQSKSVLDNHPKKCLKNQAFNLQSLSRPFKTYSDNIHEDRDNKNSVETSNSQVLNIVSDLLGLLPWDTESSSFNYKTVESTSHLNQESLDRKPDKLSHEVCRNDNQEFEEVRFSSSKETIFNFTESSQETNQYNSIPTTAPSGSDDSIIKGECNEEESVGLFSNEVETNCQEPSIGSATKGESSEWRKEYNLHSKSYEKESLQEKHRVKTESRTKRKTGNSFSDLQDVTKTHRGVRLFNCKLCEKKFSSRYDLAVHVKTHSGEKPFKFKIFGYKGTQNCSLKMHIGEKNPFESKLCADEYTERENARMHTRTHTGDNPFQCGICGYKCTVSGNLKIHMRIHTGDKPFKCELCSYKSPKRSNLKAHMKTHTADKPFQCEICGYKFTQNSNLKRHMRIHTRDKPFKCELCSYKSTKRSYLKTHMKSHTADKTFQCGICGYKFTKNGNLKRHMRIHTGDKPFKCELCEYKCIQRVDLLKHMRTHTGDKPFICQICAYKCIESSSLKKHMRIHTREKPFQCELCSYNCTQNSNLKKHMRIHASDGPFQCEICGYKCTKSGVMKKHMRSHIGDISL